MIYFNQVAFIYFTITLLNKPLNGYVRQRNRSGDDMSKIGKATILEFKATTTTFSIKFENISPAWCTFKNFCFGYFLLFFVDVVLWPRY